MAEDELSNNPEGEKPVFETVPIEETSSVQKPQPASSREDITKELAEETPESLTPESISGGTAPPEDLPPADEGFLGSGGYRKYIFIGVGVLVFLLIFVVILRSLLSLRGGSKEKANLVYWGLWEESASLEPLIKEYEQKNPNITIEYIKQSPVDYRDKLLSRVKEGRGPDIFRYHNTWLPTITDIVDKLPEKVMSPQEFEKTFYKVAQKDLGINGAYYGIPLYIDGLVLVYNNQLFKQAGLTVAPKTWGDVIKYAQELLVKDAQGNIITSGIALGTAGNVEHFSDIFGVILLQNGAGLRNLTAPEAVEALSFYRSFAEPPQAMWDETMPNNLQAFIQGKVAMIFVPSWQILTIKQANPDLDLKVAHVPTLPGGELVTLANYWVEGVSRTSKNQLEAWKFLKFLSETEQLTRLYELQTKIPRLFGNPYSRVDLKDTLVDNEYIGTVIEQTPAMQSLPLVSRTFDNGLNDEIVSYIESAINASAQGVSYSQALQQASPGVVEALDRYNIE